MSEIIDNLVIVVGESRIFTIDIFGIAKQLDLEVLSYNRRNPQKKMKATWNRLPPRPMQKIAWEKAMEKDYREYAAAIEAGES